MFAATIQHNFENSEKKSLLSHCGIAIQYSVISHNAIMEKHFEQNSTINLARFHHLQILIRTLKIPDYMYKNLMNHTVITYLQRLELELAKWRGGKYDCWSAITDEELTQRNYRDDAAFPLVD